MRRNIHPILGTVSILVFLGLLAFTLLGMLQGGESKAEQGGDVEGSVGGVDLASAVIGCQGGVPRVVLKAARQPFPEAATLVAVPSRLSLVLDNEREYTAVRQLERVSLPFSSVSTVEATLPASIADAPAEVIALKVIAPSPGGGQLESRTIIVQATEARCPSD